MVETGVFLAENDQRYRHALSVRHDVFVKEQGVPAGLEVDDHEDGATHFVAYDDGRPVGAARLRELDAARAKVERVAVRPDVRGEGWGRRVMARVEAEAADRGVSTLVLHAQRPVEEFYERLGYRTTGGEFEEAGIPHVEMQKRLE
jgi:predicted GNAT family N-acyltransferase